MINALHLCCGHVLFTISISLGLLQISATMKKNEINMYNFNQCYLNLRCLGTDGVYFCVRNYSGICPSEANRKHLSLTIKMLVGFVLSLSFQMILNCKCNS
ncbi:hypothetical protein XELAEV_18036968mg [Xenopus laevis]|uniref:Uncharacterized protein n=1 Tax=Xenopus laevis TaxID=8355 RepID=A0A974CB98_XENLA|nr:hypothetical protein XELAEV_18036968mg [Xenopus laevis]